MGWKASFSSSLLSVALVLTWGRPARAFHYFEHKWLGDVACGRIKARVGGKFECFVRQERPETGPELKSATKPTAEPKVDGLSLSQSELTFGDLVALAGDHYDTPEALLDELRAWRDHPDKDQKLYSILKARQHQASGVRGWFTARNFTSKEVAACVAGDPKCTEYLDALIRQGGDGKTVQPADCYRPLAYDESQFIATPDYLSLAAADQEHFGPRAEHHFRAYGDQARLLFEGMGKWRETIVHPAWVTAAFALHFYTDRFAAGHIRTNPLLPVSEVKRRHDFDNIFGLTVAAIVSPKTAPKEWRAYGDMCLFATAADLHRGITAIATTRALSGMTHAARDREESTLPAETAIEVPYVSDNQRTIERPVVENGVSAIKSFDNTNFSDVEPFRDDNPAVPAPPALVESALRPVVGGGAWIIYDHQKYKKTLGAGTIGVHYLINPFAGSPSGWLGFRDFGVGLQHDTTAATSGRLFVEFGYIRFSRLVASRIWLGGAFATGYANGTLWGGTTGLGIQIEPPSPYTIAIDADLMGLVGPDQRMQFAPALLFSFATRLSDGP
jgi:hypothetical protein